MRELLDRGPIELRLNGDDDVQALAASGFEETFEPQRLESPADFGGAVGEGPPGDRGVGIEIEDDEVGALEVVVLRTPGMNFKHTHLGQSGERLRSGERDVWLDLAGLLVGNIDGFHPRRKGAGHMFLEEAGTAAAFRTTHQRERPASYIGKHVRTNGPVIIRELLLGELEVSVKDLVGVSQADRCVFRSMIWRDALSWPQRSPALCGKRVSRRVA